MRPDQRSNFFNRDKVNSSDFNLFSKFRFKDEHIDGYRFNELDELSLIYYKGFTIPIDDGGKIINLLDDHFHINTSNPKKFQIISGLRFIIEEQDGWRLYTSESETNYTISYYKGYTIELDDDGHLALELDKYFISKGETEMEEDIENDQVNKELSFSKRGQSKSKKFINVSNFRFQPDNQEGWRLHEPENYSISYYMGYKVELDDDGNLVDWLDEHFNVES